MNINTEIEKATQEYLESDKLKEHIQAKAEKMVNELIDDSFGYFGGIKKQVEETIKDELKINTKELGISGFNKFITEIVKDKLDKSIRTEAKEKISKEMEKLLTPIDKVISIQKLKEVLFKEAGVSGFDVCGDPSLDDLADAGYYEDDLFTFIIEANDNPSYEWVDIYMDPRTNRDKHECQYNITVHKKFSSFRINERKIEAKDKVFGYSSGLEDFMYTMFLNESTIDYADALENA